MSTDTETTIKPPGRIYWGSYPSTTLLPNTAAGAATPYCRPGQLADVDGVLYRCIDATVGSAVWVLMPTTAGGVAFGTAYVTSSAETTIATVNTPTKIAGTTAISPNSTPVDFDMPANNRLRYTGVESGVFRLNASCSITSAANNKEFRFSFAKNGTVLTPSEVDIKLATGADVRIAHIQAISSGDTNDYWELFVEGLTDTTNCTISKMHLIAMAV